MASTSGVPPSYSVMTGVSAVTGSRSRYASINPGQALPRYCRPVTVEPAVQSFGRHAFDTHDAARPSDEVVFAEPLDRCCQRRVRGYVGDQYERGRIATTLLSSGLDADSVVGKRAGHRGQDAGPIGDVKRDVIAGRHLAHRLNCQIGIGAFARSP